MKTTSTTSAGHSHTRHTHSARCLSHIQVACPPPASLPSSGDTRVLRSTLECVMVLSLSTHSCLDQCTFVKSWSDIEWHWRLDVFTAEGMSLPGTSGSRLAMQWAGQPLRPLQIECFRECDNWYVKWVGLHHVWTRVFRFI